MRAGVDWLAPDMAHPLDSLFEPLVDVDPPAPPAPLPAVVVVPAPAEVLAAVVSPALPVPVELGPPDVVMVADWIEMSAQWW